MCEHHREAYISAKCSDLFYVATGEEDHHGYVPCDLGIGGGDYVTFAYCLECGQIRGTWPLPVTELEKAERWIDGED